MPLVKHVNFLLNVVTICHSSYVYNSVSIGEVNHCFEVLSKYLYVNYLFFFFFSLLSKVSRCLNKYRNTSVEYSNFTSGL